MGTRENERGPGRAVRLDPITDEEFGAWLLPAVRDLAEQHVVSGQWAAEEALEFAKGQFVRLLPDGARSDQQHLYTIRDAADGAAVGTLWIGMRRKAGELEAYVYDVVVLEGRRGRGYGRAAMLAAADRARELGAHSLGLHVFGHNAVARALYESLGFVATNVSMSLPLEAEADAEAAEADEAPEA
jgi:ribosomal protein S18 acetylase RimI-like enzyme